jgi:HEAT repeat protein
MVRLLAAILACTLAPSLAAAAPTAAPAPPATPAVAKPAAKPAPPLDWRSRLAVAVRELQKTDPALLARLENLQPVRAVDGELSFAAEARAATVLLRRLLAGKDPAEVRGAIVDALPQTGGDWQEGAAALIGIDASPRVRKRLVEIMRYADAPHSVHGLRLGFKDEDPEVNIAAARTAGFSRQGPELAPELYSSTFDTDWDLRAAAVQSLGMLKAPAVARDPAQGPLRRGARGPAAGPPRARAARPGRPARAARARQAGEGPQEPPHRPQGPAAASRAQGQAQGRRRRAGDHGEDRCPGREGDAAGRAMTRPRGVESPPAVP